MFPRSTSWSFRPLGIALFLFIFCRVSCRLVCSTSFLKMLFGGFWRNRRKSEKTLGETYFRWATISGWRDVNLIPVATVFVVLQIIVSRWFVFKYPYFVRQSCGGGLDCCNKMNIAATCQWFSSTWFCWNSINFFPHQFHSLGTARNQGQRCCAACRFLAKEGKNPQYHLIVSWVWRTTHLSRQTEW